MANAMTPEMVAERWQCSATHVRSLFRQGKLRGFRVGERLIRFRIEDIEKFEQAMTPPPDEYLVRSTRTAEALHAFGLHQIAMSGSATRRQPRGRKPSKAQ